MQLESERLRFRELQASDADSMFALHSDPQVLRYVGEKPIRHVDQVREIIEDIRRQYQDFGVGRLAVLLKSTNEFIGWAGLKYIVVPEKSTFSPRPSSSTRTWSSVR